MAWSLPQDYQRPSATSHVAYVVHRSSAAKIRLAGDDNRPGLCAGRCDLTRVRHHRFRRKRVPYQQLQLRRSGIEVIQPPRDAHKVTGVEMNERHHVFAACVDHGPPEAFRETGFEVGAAVVVGQVGDHEASSADIDADLVVDEPCSRSQSLKHEAGVPHSRREELGDNAIEFRLVELHGYEHALSLWSRLQ